MDGAETSPILGHYSELDVVISNLFAVLSIRFEIPWWATCEEPPSMEIKGTPLKTIGAVEIFNGSV